ncbi:MAG: non-canonical purine NTP diphosphatase [Bacteroidia bacterium]
MMSKDFELIFATNNQHKLQEVRFILKDACRLISLQEAGIDADIPENEDTIEGNALAKARFIYKITGKDCFADDTGLEVIALNGAPGVYSARYAGEPSNAERNINKLLYELEGKEDRKAQFKTVIALILQGKEQIFEGIVEGIIALQCRGESGFGYDPVFIPDEYHKSFAEMNAAEKNRISHRARALEKMKEFLYSPCRSNF